MAAPLSNEERNARVSATLRQVDEDVKAKRFDEALEKVRRVYEFDIKNIYARAYEERILAMKVEKERDEAMQAVEQRAKERADEEVKRRLKEFYKQQEVEAQKRRVLEKQEQDLEDRARKASVNEVQQVATKDISAIESEALRRIQELEQRLTAQIQAAAKTVAPAGAGEPEAAHRGQFEAIDVERRKIQEEAFLRFKEEQKRTNDELLQQYEQERETAIRRAAEQEKERGMEAYRSIMFLLVQLHVESDLRDAILQSLKISLSISDSEHLEIERAVQVNTYIEAVRTLWQRGNLTEDDQTHLANLRHLYHIVDDEHQMITKRIKKELGLADDSAVIFVIDDDPSIRKYAEHILRKTYRTVITAVNAEEALKSIPSTIPSLVLTDINLGAGVMSGFSFYEKVKAGTFGDVIRDVPFVLMSSMEDEFFIRTAKQLGVKAYLPKPFTKEILETTIRASLG